MFKRRKNSTIIGNLPRSQKRVKSPRARAVRVEPLEQRRMLATFAETGSTLNITLEGDHLLIVSGAEGGYHLTISNGASAGTWSGTDSANVMRSTPSFLIVTTEGQAQFTSGINITDSGSGGSVDFSSTNSTYSNNILINLSNSGSSLDFRSASFFTGDATFTASVNGDIVVENGAKLSMGNGALSLSATGNLSVGAGAIVNSGTGLLTVAADVKPDGSGDDGIGTLSIGAGAEASSWNSAANAVTLRGADIDIDASANPARVGASDLTPSKTLTGLSQPRDLVFDGNGNLYVSNSSGTTVSEFAPSSTTPTTTLTGLSNPYGLAVDSYGNLFVGNTSGALAGTVSKFAPGSIAPTAALTGALNQPAALAIDGMDTLYVGGFNNHITIFANGTTTPSGTLSGVFLPIALTFDASGNLYSADANYSGFGNNVVKFAPGSSTPSLTMTGVSNPSDVIVDSAGNVYVANFGGSFGGGVNGGGTTVSKFAPVAQPPRRH